MAIELTKEQLAKVITVRDLLRRQGLPQSLVHLRVANYRRTLSLDMENYKRRANPERRAEAIAKGKVPQTVVPNAKASKRLSIRIAAFEGMKATEQAAHTRPGSLSK